MRRHIIMVLASALVGGLAGAADVTLSVDNATPNVNDTIAVTIHASIPAGEACVAANQFLAFDPAKLHLTAQSAGSAGVFVPDSRGLAAINATGVVLHTNLGRAPLAAAALEAMVEVARAASTLEYDVAAGARGSRHVHCATLLAELTGAEEMFLIERGWGSAPAMEKAPEQN